MMSALAHARQRQVPRLGKHRVLDSYAVFFRAARAKRDTTQLHHAYSGSVARAHAARVMQKARATMIPEPRRSMANLETTGGGLSAVTTARISNYRAYCRFGSARSPEEG
jgi:hypothetical protein